MTKRSWLTFGGVVLLWTSAHAGDLRFSARNQDHIRGNFSNPAHAFEDESEAEIAPDAMSAPQSKAQRPQRTVKAASIDFDSKCTSQRCELTLTLNGKRIRVYQNIPAEDIHIRFGSFKMTEPIRDAFIELEKQLNNKPLPWTHTENLLFSVVTMLTEAPIGYKIGNMDLDKPENAGPSATDSTPIPENMSVVPNPDGEDQMTDEEALDAALHAEPDITGDPFIDARPLQVPDPQSMWKPDPQREDCVVDVFGKSRPSKLFMRAFTCCMSCQAPNTGSNVNDLSCWPFNGNHFEETWHDFEEHRNAITVCRGTVMPAGYHCMKRMFLPYGQFAFDRFLCRYNTCPGRCGAGCAASINEPSRWTAACFNHDECVRSHKANPVNPNDPGCGDEYKAAIRDYLWGWPRPGGC
jgi:hypothetical protein